MKIILPLQDYFHKVYLMGSVFLDGVAQLVEHRTHKPGVVGSIPTSVTGNKSASMRVDISNLHGCFIASRC